MAEYKQYVYHIGAVACIRGGGREAMTLCIHFKGASKKNM